MNDCVDDRTPLLQPFVRGSLQRTTVKRYKAIPDTCPQNAQVSNCKPPLPPRPSEFSQTRILLRRSVSVTEGREDNTTEISSLRRVAPQNWHGSDGADDWRVPLPVLHSRSHITSAGRDGTSLHQSDAQTHTYGTSDGTHTRNGYQFASMPRSKRTPPASPDVQWMGIPAFHRKPSSFSFSEREETQTEDITSTRKENSNDSKPSISRENSFMRRFRRSGRSQTPPPPCPSPLLSPVTYKRDISTNPQSPGSFRRYGSVPMKKTFLPPHPMSVCSDGVGRSSSFRHPRLEKRRCSTLTSPLSVMSYANAHQTEKDPLLYSDSPRYFAPDDRQSGGWRAQMMPVKGKDLAHIHDRQGLVVPERNDPRRFSYIGQPVTPNLNTELQTQSHLSTTFSGDLTTTITTITASTTTTTFGSSSPSHRPPEYLDLDDRGSLQGSWDRSYSGTMGGTYSDDSGGGSRHRKMGSPSLDLSRVSSDSGYSTCSNSSGVSRSNSIISEGEDDMIAWFGSHINIKEKESLEAKAPTDHFSYLMEKEEEYLVCLRSILKDYQDMNSKTPSLIRQHFDVIFKQVELIYAFQKVLQDELRETRGQPDKLARVFTNEQFQCYGRYMVMMPAVQRDLLQYANHFKEHFPDLKQNILKPSLHINFYAMILDSFKKETSGEVKSELQAAIDYLNQVKRKANTEMTLKTVVHSPVDLRLGGDLLHIGELYYIGGGTLQKKKYQVMLFENLLVITSMKLPCFKYKIHYRVEQLESVGASGENELLLNVFSDGQTQLVTLRFRTKSQNIRDEWMNELEKITRQNTKLLQGRSSVNLLQIPMQQFRTLPLDLFRVFPLVKEVVTDDVLAEGRTERLDGYSLPNMICYEEKYVHKLSSLLNPENQRPPEPLSDLLEKLHRLHTRQFLPALQSSQKVSDFLDYLVENLDQLSVYTDYLVIRSQLTVKLDEAPQAGPYISPVQHIYGIYFSLMKRLCGLEKYKKSAQRVIKKLQEDIRLAQLRVLKEAIVSGRVDFHRCGKLLLYSPLEVRTRKKEVRAGEYIVLLFEKVIILTKRKQPYYEYVMDIWLDQVNLGPPASHDCIFRLEVRQGGKKEPITYEMCASTVELKQKWHKCLQQQMLVQVVKIRERCVHS